MKRYTNRLDDGQAIMNCQDCDTDWTNKHAPKCTVMYCRNRLKDRVAAYEDTGLEPQEIERIVDAYGRWHALRTELAERLEIIREIPTDRLRELVEADRDGRCKHGDTVYQADTERVYELEVKKIIYDCGHIAFDSEAIGKTVFPTREAAEAALEGEQYGVH